MDKILFFDYIEENLKYSFLSQNIIIINKRNKLIYFTFIQVFFSIFGMIIFKLRRTIVFVYANIFILFLALCGIYGSIKINSICLFVHCILTLSLGFALFLYLIISDIFSEESKSKKNSGLNEHLLLIIFCLPYLYDMFCGYYNYSWLLLLSKLNEKDSYNLINNNPNEYNESLLNVNNNNNNNNNEIKIEMDDVNRNSNNICQICYENNKNTVFSPCGHTFCCYVCWEVLKKKNINKCPICRKKIENCLKIYN